MGTIDKEFERFVLERLNAAKSGPKNAQGTALYDLGLLYSAGQGVERNYMEAYKFFHLAAISGLKRAKVDYKDMEQMLSGVEITRAKHMVQQWIDVHTH